MLYIKTTTPNGKEVHTPLDEIAVFSVCPVCGREHKTDFYELLDCFEDSGFDCGVNIWCNDCSKVKEAIAND